MIDFWNLLNTILPTLVSALIVFLGGLLWASLKRNHKLQAKVSDLHTRLVSLEDDRVKTLESGFKDFVEKQGEFMQRFSGMEATLKGVAGSVNMISKHLLGNKNT